MLPPYSDLQPDQIAAQISALLRELNDDRSCYRQALGGTEPESPAAARVPYFCSGCPHSTSTKVPEGSKSFAGIGCHYMALWMNRGTEGFTHMGGEGANWIGCSPYTHTSHMFQNMGDGTYFHSGYLAIRAAVSANVNITYKILFNDAVAMTGGQRIDGELSPLAIARQVVAEGVRRVAVVSEKRMDSQKRNLFPAGTTIHELDHVQKELIAVFRAEQGLSRRQLAEAVGVNHQTIGYLERGDYKPSLELALKIARHFGVAVEMLFSLERFESIAMTLKRAGEDE